MRENSGNKLGRVRSLNRSWGHWMWDYISYIHVKTPKHLQVKTKKIDRRAPSGLYFAASLDSNLKDIARSKEEGRATTLS